MRKKFEELEFTDDFMFGKVLTTRPDLCKKLLELILGVEIKEIRPPEGQKSMEASYGSKGIRLDVYVNDEKGTVFDLEMQSILKADIPKRARYYQGMIDLSMIEKGELYSELKKSYVIFICTGDLFGKRLPVYTFENVCLEDKSLRLGDEAIKVIINPDSDRTGLSEEMNSFLDLLVGKKATKGVAKEIAAVIASARKDKRWEGDYMTFDMKLREEREEGRIEGRIDMLADLVRKGKLSKAEAAAEAGLTEAEFEEHLKSYN